MRNVYADLDGVCAEWRTGATGEDLRKEGYWHSLKPMEIAGFINSLAKRADISVYVLSAYMTDTNALAEKRCWVKENMPSIPASHMVFVPCGINKARAIEEMRRRKLTEEDILVDDYTANLTEWQEAGGKAVKWLNGINGKKGRFNGIRTDSLEELRGIIIPHAYRV